MSTYVEAKVHVIFTFKIFGFASKAYMEVFGLGSKFVYKTEEVLLKKMRSAGFEPAIPSLGSSYLNLAGLTSLPIMNITHDLKFEIIRLRFRHTDNNKKL